MILWSANEFLSDFIKGLHATRPLSARGKHIYICKVEKDLHATSILAERFNICLMRSQICMTSWSWLQRCEGSSRAREPCETSFWLQIDLRPTTPDLQAEGCISLFKLAVNIINHLLQKEKWSRNRPIPCRQINFFAIRSHQRESISILFWWHPTATYEDVESIHTPKVPIGFLAKQSTNIQQCSWVEPMRVMQILGSRFTSNIWHVVDAKL